MPPTERQVEFFHKLTTDRDFGEQNVENLRTQFAGLAPAAASAWIDKAMTLPRASSAPGGEDGATTPPPF